DQARLPSNAGSEQEFGVAWDQFEDFHHFDVEDLTDSGDHIIEEFLQIAFGQRPFAESRKRFLLARTHTNLAIDAQAFGDVAAQAEQLHRHAVLHDDGDRGFEPALLALNVPAGGTRGDMARASARFCRSPRGYLWRPAAQSPPVRSRACPRKCSPGGRERFRGWSTKPSDGTEDPMTIGRPARPRAPIETTQSRNGKATLVRKPECRPFHLYLALQALSHPPCDGSFDPQRRFRARATQRFADEGTTRGPCMRILPSGPVESSIGSTLASWKQPFSLRARSATARTTT